MFFRPPKYVRVKDKATKHEYSVVASTFDEESMELLDKKAAVKCDGTPLEPKYHVVLKSLSSPVESPVESTVETPVESNTTERPQGRTIRQGE